MFTLSPQLLAGLFCFSRLYLSESLVATLIGIILGPVGLGLLQPNKWGSEPHKVTLAFTEFVIAIQVMAAAISLPSRFWKEQWVNMSLLFGPVMLWMWLVSALLMWLILGVSWANSLILAACLAPTDPILANSIVTGRFADKYIAVPVRLLLSGESAANDGLAIPFFQLGLYLVAFPAKKAWATWAYHIVLYVKQAGERNSPLVGARLGSLPVLFCRYEVGVGIIFGAVVGYLTKFALKASERRNYIDKRSFLSVEIALALFVLGFASMLHLASFLSVFVAGLVFAWDGWFTEETVEAHVQEVVDNLINLTFFIYFGAIIPWSNFTINHSIPSLLLFSLSLLFFRRLPPVLFLHHYAPRPPLLSRREAFLVGYFGPIGVGALWYITYAFDEEVIGEDSVALVFWVVWCSVVMYGITAVLMHGLVRTISVVRVYSGRSFNGRTLSFSGPAASAAWPRDVPVTSNQISGPIVSPADIANILHNPENGPAPGLSADTMTTDVPGILIKETPPEEDSASPAKVTVDDDGDDDGGPLRTVNSTSSYTMIPLYRTSTPRSIRSARNRLVVGGGGGGGGGITFHDTIDVDESLGSPGEMGIAPGSVTERHDEDVGEEMLVGSGVRFARTHTDAGG
ncbi:hypothetical protein HDU86_002430 [Geranomyces michiganensis]|nr:hypothetical protein HDU86_002430 [Geranomyces michiganensis]